MAYSIAASDRAEHRIDDSELGIEQTGTVIAIRPSPFSIRFNKWLGAGSRYGGVATN